MTAVTRARPVLAALALSVFAACSGGSTGAPASSHPAAPATAPAAAPAPAPAHAAPTAPAAPITIAVIGTADLHGHIETVPWLGGYLDNLRRSHALTGVLLVDAGDMFQGTLESNTVEGRSIVEAYNRLGYAAAAVGNHEFDFGPAGEKTVPKDPGDDPRGALKARAAEAHFPFLDANIIDDSTGKPAAWPNFRPSVMVERAGIKIGIVGVTTTSTPRTTLPANVVGLSIAPLAPTIESEAARLRAEGAQAVVVVAHAGGECRDLHHPTDLSSCDPDQEIFQVANALPEGEVDVIVAGHTHAGVAQRVHGIPVVQSFAKGLAFGRVDLTFDARGHVIGRRIYPPTSLCKGHHPGGHASAGVPDATTCQPGSYAGRPVTADKAVTEVAKRYLARAREVRESKLGVIIDRVISRAHAHESPLGNLFCDLMRVARPRADVTLTNGGGLRADLPAGPLTYGDLYQAMPFDNRFAEIRITGAELAWIIKKNLESASGFFSLSGIKVRATCKGGALRVTLTRDNGRRIRARDHLLLVTSDFLASGGDNLFAGRPPAARAITIEQGQPIRDVLARVLRTRGGHLSGSDPALYNREDPRVVYPGQRPVKCH